MKISLSGAIAASGEIRKRASANPDPPLSPAQFASGVSYGQNQTVQTDWDERRAIQEGFRSSTWPFACMDRLQGAASTVPWVVYEKRGRKRQEWEKQDAHPYEKCIEYPLDEYISRQQMIAGMVLSILCGGNALLRVLYTGPQRDLVPSELHPMSTALWRPVPVGDFDPVRFSKNREGVERAEKWIRGYRRIDKPTSEMLEPWKVVHAQKLDPGSYIWGMSPLRPIAPIIDMDRAMIAWNARLPNSFMVPPGAFVDRNLKTDGQLNEAARILAARYNRQDGVPLVLGAGTDWLRMAITPVEADWDASRQMNRDEVCAALNVSPTLFISDAKYANLESGKAHLLEMGAHDLLVIIEDAFNRAFVPKARRGEIYVAFDLSGVPGLRDTLPDRMRSHEIAVKNGIPINTSIAMHKLDCGPIPGGDKALVSGALVPLEQMLEPPGARPGPLATPGKEEEPAPEEEDDSEE